MSMKRLCNKVAVITGGSRGIGKAIGALYLREGAKVILLGTSTERGEEARKELSEMGGEAIFYKVDVSNFQEVQAFSERIIAEHGGIDILVNCAGVTEDKLLMKMGEEDWDKVLDTNLKSVYNMCHAFIRTMIKNRAGTIINVSSVIAFMGNPGQTNYAASKAGMIGFTRSLAKEVASRKITVNAIAPGYIETDMTGKIPENYQKLILEQIPLGRMGQAQEIAYAALFLASEEARYITGQTLTIDGGLTA